MSEKFNKSSVKNGKTASYSCHSITYRTDEEEYCDMNDDWDTKFTFEYIGTVLMTLNVQI
jgi:hypothetical protein